VQIRKVVRIPLLLLAMAAASSAFATPALATPALATHSSHPAAEAVHLDGGRTSLRIDRGTAGVLADNGVSVTAISGASGQGRRFTFPITGGDVVPATAAGTIEHDGGLRFAAGGVSLGVEDFVIDTTAGVLTARVSGTHTRVPLLALDTGNARIGATKSRLTIRNVEVSLTSEAAGALNATFGVDLFTEGLLIGTTRTVARF